MERAIPELPSQEWLKIARLYNDEKMVATLSQQLTWSHFIELAAISQPNKRLFYQQMSIVNSWSVRQLRDQEDAMAYERSLIAAKPDDVHSVSKYALLYAIRDQV